MGDSSAPNLTESPTVAPTVDTPKEVSAVNDDKKPKMTYSREEMLELSQLPASTRRPADLNTDFLKMTSGSKERQRKTWWEDRTGRKVLRNKGKLLSRNRRRPGDDRPRSRKMSESGKDGRDYRNHHDREDHELENMPEWAVDDGDADFEFGRTDLEEDRARYKKEKLGIDADTTKSRNPTTSKKSGEEKSKSEATAKMSSNPAPADAEDGNDDINKMFASLESNLSIKGFAPEQGKSATKTRSRFGFGFSQPQHDSDQLPPGISTKSKTSNKANAAVDTGKRSRFGFILSENESIPAPQRRVEKTDTKAMNSGLGLKLELRDLFGSKASSQQLHQHPNQQHPHQQHPHQQHPHQQQSRQQPLSRSDIGRTSDPRLPSLPHLPDLPEFYAKDQGNHKLSAKQLFLLQNEGQERKMAEKVSARNRKVENVHADDVHKAFSMAPHSDSSHMGKLQHVKPNSIYSSHDYNQAYGRRGNYHSQPPGLGVQAHPQPYYHAHHSRVAHNVHMDHHHYVEQQRRQQERHQHERHQHERQHVRQQPPSMNFQRQRWAGRPPPAQYGTHNGRHNYHHHYHRESEYVGHHKLNGGPEQPQTFKKLFGHML